MRGALLLNDAADALIYLYIIIQFADPVIQKTGTLHTYKVAMSFYNIQPPPQPLHLPVCRQTSTPPMFQLQGIGYHAHRDHSCERNKNK